MTTLSIPTTTLSDGAELPLIGFGTSSMKGTGAVEGIAAALRSGYRLIDTAAQYGNEASVGEAIRASGVDSDEVLVTTKIAGGDQGREAARTGYLESLRRLGLDSAALVLIHWPNPSRGLAVDTWRTLIDLKEEGRVQHIGVSNFRPEQTEELVEATGVWPEVNQIQLSPALQRRDTLAFHREHGIVTEAWGPLGGREGLAEQFALRKVAEKHGVQPSQVSLRWAIDQGIVVIPKSSSPERQRDNATLDHIALDDADRELLASLDLGEQAAWDSREHEEW
ncbi:MULTISPECIES: aldo/keto reductase [Brachybacterium]|uniref:Aldo/keto reductase n=1 Tax=Brachybacterium alimentarium TaxID=47845 RepID=A0A2A3YJV9_9MICO|nr:MULTISPECIES: aldo/keto reductase [Brachybacterium]PCC31497.1 aldo/keto reductase [Brachybacterium alimentarium]PCC39583.1 aldo/keto reductase [Brachybacterium alimentarium]RCS65061.1 aldo/keto reductase [Brachybacterium sp. JB7]RCS69762.1 aldo/keto reductase [Brachybacterium alimentarium]RCS75751.1 aldo/keto reductase [Brachybacterium alimentarium]